MKIVLELPKYNKTVKADNVVRVKLFNDDKYVGIFHVCQYGGDVHVLSLIHI